MDGLATDLTSVCVTSCAMNVSWITGCCVANGQLEDDSGKRKAGARRKQDKNLQDQKRWKARKRGTGTELDPQGNVEGVEISTPLR